MDLQKRHKTIVVIIMGSFSWLCPLSAQVHRPADSIACKIDVLCSFPDLEVWLDGQKIGHTPLLSFALVKGDHHLRVAHPDPSDWLQRDWERHFTINAGEIRRFDVAFPKTFWLDSNPSGASIFIEDRWMGLTPLVIHVPPDSLAFLSLKKSGFEDYRYHENQILPTMLYAQLKENLSGEDFQQERPRLTRKWIMVGGIVAVICGGIGFYFKAKADRAYEDYLSSSHPQSMNRYYNDAVTLDKYTGVFYGLAEISLGVTLFYFIRSVE